MAVSLGVALLSGRSSTIEVSSDTCLNDLKRRAEAALGLSGTLLAASGASLAGEATVSEANLQTGDQLTLLTRPVAPLGTKRSWAAIFGDGSVATWGHSDRAGRPRKGTVQQLKNVQQLQATDEAFAAILDDGSVVAWGELNYGGDCSAVQEQLVNVRQIQANRYAFAAICGDRSVVTWGSNTSGGDSSSVQDQLKDVQAIQSSSRAFVAILRDGSAVAWGASSYGGDSSEVQD
ncbi:HERC2, partial [Symbiodinium microadriaticum]